ncbi:50S ribosomal protein L32 [soil metagenome]
MANPKRRHSKARTAKRRSQYKVRTLPEVQECPNCGSPHLRHRACPSCGTYRGRQIIAGTEAV